MVKACQYHAAIQIDKQKGRAKNSYKIFHNISQPHLFFKHSAVVSFWSFLLRWKFQMDFSPVIPLRFYLQPWWSSCRRRQSPTIASSFGAKPKAERGREREGSRHRNFCQFALNTVFLKSKVSSRFRDGKKDTEKNRIWTWHCSSPFESLLELAD